jgi:hypothetical protein
VPPLLPNPNPNPKTEFKSKSESIWAHVVFERIFRVLR